MQLPQSFIKNLALEINPCYEFKNIPIPILKDTERGNNINNNFIGRKLHIDKFISFLQDSKKGIFLVTGYRGMGKTSFVNHVINKYRYEEKEGGKNIKKIIPITITLAQNEPKEIDILRLMATSVFNKYIEFIEAQRKTVFWKNKYNERHNKKWQRNWRIVSILSLILTVIPVLIFLKFDALKEFISVSNGGIKISPVIAIDWIKKVSIVVTISTLVIFFVSLTFYYCLKIKEQNKKGEHDNAFNCIKWLVERSNSVIFEEKQNFGELGIQNFGAQILAANEKRNKEYPIATSKEIENELSRFLDLATKEDELEFIFIFDELDKVDPAISTSYLYDDTDTFEKQKSEGVWQRELRDRKQAIINIIAGQKNFLTTADARFVFIAGHEMFDASMADIADRQSSISSIFTYIFNIESLLKEFEINVNKKSAENNDYVTNYSSLSFAIEEFLKKTLFTEEGETSAEGLYSMVLKRYKKNMGEGEINPNELVKIYITLQNFVIYLTYRSNGSPKKLIREIQEFIRNIDKKNLEQFKRKGIVGYWVNYIKEFEGNKRFLLFNYYEQYRLEFINYLYRPFLISNGRNFKHYSDNIIVSTPYLFDHLLKFHPFAFSHTNLELIPEVLSTNKTPSLKDHIRQIITYLCSNHIRETEIGLFDYKFYSRTLNELSFLSKKFEKESAAFNFTLDESYLVKLDIRNKIKEVRNIYSKSNASKTETNKLIFSIAHLNGMLGDLHFFDQEFNDSIVAYADAIGPINYLDVSTMSITDFITIVRNKLKLGLCFEKINSFEDALAFYSDCSEDSKKYLLNRLEVSKQIQVKNVKSLLHHNFAKPEKIEFYDNSSINDLLQIINQSFIAKIIIQEKLGVEGISTPKISIALGGFLKISEIVAISCGKNHVICANAYLLTGKALYFKNSSTVTHSDPKYLRNYPDNAANTLRNLREKLNNIFFKNNDTLHKRKPILSLCFYIIGLQEILSSREIKYGKTEFREILNKAILKQNSNIIDDYLSSLNEFLYRGDESFTGIHYRYIAIFLSNIGDCLLSSLNEADSKQQYKEYYQMEIFDSRKIDKLFSEKSIGNSQNSVNIFDYFLDSTKGKVTLVDILKCYYLSGLYFQRYGRLASCSFQFRKILHIIKLVIKKEAEKKICERFCGFIFKNLVQPIIDIANTNIGHCDSHIKSKAIKLFEEICTLDKYYVENNIFKHPEIVEANLLYNFILLKLELPLNEMEGKIIANENTITTQFSRIHELHFHTTYIEKIYLKSLLKPLLTLSKIETGVTYNPPFSYKNNFISPRKYLEMHENNISDYLFCMFSILRTLKIYGTDYLMGYSFIAFKYYKIGVLLNFINKYDLNGSLMKKVKENLEFVFNEKLFGSFDHNYHLNMAKEYFQKTIQLHTSGNEYKKAVSEMVYLEDDFNDNAYHFGAAYDRYMMVNSVFLKKIEQCEKIISH